MNTKVTVNQEGGKALMRLRLLCTQVGLDFDKTLSMIIAEYLRKNEMKLEILSKIPDYRKR